MRTTMLLSLSALTLALPAGAQERPAQPERPRRPEPGVFTLRRAVEMARAPRAVLGITTGTGDGLADTAGVLVQDVTENGPAARAGIEKGARLTEIDGVSLRITRADAEDPVLARIGTRRLTRTLDAKKPGDEVQLRVASGGQTRTVRVRLADPDSLFPRRAPRAMGNAREVMRARLANRASLGIQVGSSGSRRDTLGVFIAGVDDEGPAARAGIYEGARIAAVNGVDLRVNRADIEDPMVAGAKVRQLMRELEDVKPGDEVELRVWQNGQYRTTRVRTVSADSLRGNRRTIIIGDGPGAGMMMGPGMRIPEGGDFGAFRLMLSPQFREELEVILDGAVHGAHEALEGAEREVRKIERRQRIH